MGAWGSFAHAGRICVAGGRHLDRTTVVEGPDGVTSPGEPVFVTRENARAEDDGCLLTLWWNRATNLSELLIHDATDLRRAPWAGSSSPTACPSVSTAAGPTITPWTGPSRPTGETPDKAGCPPDSA
ncbi:carotenoid oxygenase family protein [Streptomyces sp. NPDC002680]|uniref:carotenoid oxygenase family protein n=1 Tax=Streptomyces sp. NPDC002680 TaxID=3364659 RepID=UPI00368D1590